MAIKYTPKVGELLECHYGDFKYLPGGDIDNRNFDGRIPPEMIKKRLVVVLNGKIGSGVIVVPISSTSDAGKIQQGWHTAIPQESIRITDFYDRRDRWAKGDLIQQISKERLFKLKDNGAPFEQYLHRDIVTLIQKSVIKAISAKSLMHSD